MTKEQIENIKQRVQLFKDSIRYHDEILLMCSDGLNKLSKECDHKLENGEWAYKAIQWEGGWECSICEEEVTIHPKDFIACTCKYCNKSAEHTPFDCPQNTRRKCYLCKAYDHESRDCPYDNGPDSSPK
jgi:hypothetical protein